MIADKEGDAHVERSMSDGGALLVASHVLSTEDRRMANDASIGTRTYAAAHFALELQGVEKLGLFRSIEGGGIKADVMTYQNGGIYDRWRQVGKPKFEDVKLTFGMAMAEPFYKWIKLFFAGTPARKDGAIVAADFYYKERARREFTNAMIKELTFPKLDANDKNSAYANVSLAVEDMKFKPGTSAQIDEIKGDGHQKAWKACNFRFSLDGFNCCTRVTKVESFTVKQNVLEYHMGGARAPILSPSAMDYPQISFTLPEADAQPLADRFMLRAVKGELPGRFGGQIETFDNSGDNKFVFQFKNADIINMQPDKSDSTTEEMKCVKVDLYVESMTFDFIGTSGEIL
jgi:phage tail-like protein